MKAKEMFEELGYRLTTNQTPIQRKFYKKVKQGKYLGEHIIFEEFENNDYCIITYAIRNGRCEHLEIYKVLNEAIQKQIEELGWNERKQ